MIRVRDFAVQQGVSERTVQLKLKASKEILEGHVDRRGKLGTWLDEFAQDYLRGQLMHQTVQVVESSETVQRLLADLAEAEKRCGKALEEVARLNEERAQLIEEYGGRLLIAEGNVAEAEARVTAAEEQGRKDREAADTALKELAKLKGENDILKNVVNSKTRQISDLETENGDLKAENGDLKSAGLFTRIFKWGTKRNDNV